jgi:TolB protein
MAAAAGISVAAQSTQAPAADPSSKLQVLFNRYLVPAMTVVIADADGSNEHALVPTNGLEYSPSFSADGQWVVYTADREGQADIYRIHPDGTGQQQLTDDAAFDDQGALSPDGKTLAFVSTRGGGTANIWLMDVGSKRYTNLTKHSSGNFRPSWSPDGRWIAFASDRDVPIAYYPGQWEHLQSTGLYVIQPDGKGLRRLTRKDGVAGSPSWSSDGTKVLYYETDEVGAYLAKTARGRTEVVSVDVRTGERTQYTASNDTKLSPHWLSGGRISYVIRSGDDTQGLKIWHPDRRVVTIVKGAIRNPSWSPDGKRVAYQRLTRTGTTQVLVPTISRVADVELLLSEPFPAFSSNGDRLVFSQYQMTTSPAHGLEATSPGDTSIEIMSSDGSEKRTLFHRKGFGAYAAVWSPSGNDIALSVGRFFRAAGLPPAQIALIKPDGSDFRLLVDDDKHNAFPSWSPDGTRLVFKRGRQIVIMSLTDRTIVPLTDETAYNNFPQWSPKGDAITFTSNRDGNFEVYTIRPDGTQLRRLTNAPGNDAHSVWCSDGETIVFGSGRMGFKDEMALYEGTPQPYGEIFTMRADGTDVRQLTDNKWEDAAAGCKPRPRHER